MHGVLPGRKEEGITRLLYKNANGIYNRLRGNEKLDKAKDLLNELGAAKITGMDGISFLEGGKRTSDWW